MRNDASLASQLRQLQIEREEIKESQLVGKSQLLVKETISEPITITSETKFYISEAYASCKVEAPSVTGNNVLIAYAVAEVYTETNTLVDNHDPSEYTFHINSIKSDNGDTAGFQLTVYHSSQQGEDIPVENYSIRFHVWSAATVNLTVEEGPYGA